ncbi:MAG TPA: hypothetical protein PK011_16720, partial [Marinagarivorans sp.]|nr:hypothetical protein [Marinagarivorans sp.]
MTPADKCVTCRKNEQAQGHASSSGGQSVDEKFIKSCTIWVDWLKGRNSVSWFGIIINSEFSFSVQLTAEKVDIENGKALLKSSFNPEFYIRGMRPSESELTEKMANLYKFYDRLCP